MKFNLQGDMLATSSSNENLVKIFQVPTCKKLVTLQPSFKEPWQIIDFIFCSVSDYFAVLIASKSDSSREAPQLYIELFCLENIKQNREESPDIASTKPPSFAKSPVSSPKVDLRNHLTDAISPENYYKSDKKPKLTELDSPNMKHDKKI